VTADTPDRRNVVCILVDDLGWRDLGCYGSPFYETPTIDRLARDGTADWRDSVGAEMPTENPEFESWEGWTGSDRAGGAPTPTRSRFLRRPVAANPRPAQR
jgi:hypothetical protein